MNWNTRELLRECLLSISRDAQCGEWEIILIDNGSTDGSVRMVREEFSHVRVMENETNEGFARPNNTGISLAQGKYILLLNSDAAVTPGAIQSLVDYLGQHPDVGACGPMLVYPDGTVQRSVRGFPTLWTHVCDMLFLDKLFPNSKLFGRGEMAYCNYGQTQHIDHVMAAAFLVRREMLATVGGLDERFSIYYNDMDWCYRMMKAGWKVAYVHTSNVIHHHGQTVQKLNRDFAYFEELYNNVLLYYYKHIGHYAVALYKLLLVVGFLMRTIGWGVVRVVRHSDHALLMSRFSWKSLRFGMKFWIPLPYHYRHEKTPSIPLVEM